jgi:integrase
MARGIYKRGSIYWIRYAGLDSRIVRESSRSDKFKDAETLLIQRKQAIKEGKQPEIKRIANYTFNELVTEYIKWAERQRCFRSKSHLIEQLKETFGNLPLRRFNTMLLEQFQSERLQKGKEREVKAGYKPIPVKGNKPATVNRFIATLSHMFTKAVEWDMVEEETLKRIRKVKMLPENNKRLRYLSKEECQNLINACDKHLRSIVITALNTGMRKGEILNLKWNNVDLRHGFILLDVTKNGERREIPINNSLKAIFLDRNLIRRIDVPYVFYDPVTGDHYQDVKRSFHTALRRAKIKDFKFHDLRHTFASHLVMAGVDLTTVKELLGHKTLTMTLRYAHLAPSHKVNAVDMLDNAINEKPSAQKLHNLAVVRGS